MRGPLTPQTLRAEIASARAILKRCLNSVDNGIPGIDTPASPESYEEFMNELVGELRVVSSKAAGLADAILGG